MVATDGMGCTDAAYTMWASSAFSLSVPYLAMNELILIPFVEPML
jgi:hypothetical protein